MSREKRGGVRLRATRLARLPLPLRQPCACPTPNGRGDARAAAYAAPGTDAAQLHVPLMLGTALCVPGGGGGAEGGEGNVPRGTRSLSRNQRCRCSTGYVSTSQPLQTTAQHTACTTGSVHCCAATSCRCGEHIPPSGSLGLPDSASPSAFSPLAKLWPPPPPKVLAPPFNTHHARYRPRSPLLPAIQQT